MATSPPDPADKPLIGKEIPWKPLEGQVFRISHFSPFATVDGDKVSAPSPPMPYAVLTVESPILNQAALMPVNHRDEFLNLRDIYEQRGVASDEELLVSYLPYKGFLGPFVRLFGPRLHLRIRPKGDLERYYSDDQHWQKPSARQYFLPSRVAGRRCSNCGSRLYTFVVRCPKCRRPVID